MPIAHYNLSLSRNAWEVVAIWPPYQQFQCAEGLFGGDGRQTARRFAFRARTANADGRINRDSFDRVDRKTT